MFLFQHTIYIPQPTWGNHPKVFTLAGLSVKTYRYYNPATRGLDFAGTRCLDCDFRDSFWYSDFSFVIIFFSCWHLGLLDDLNEAPSGAIVLLHACAHNPTGVDPTLEQWEQIRQLMRSKGLLPFFDSAYQVS